MEKMKSKKVSNMFSIHSRRLIIGFLLMAVIYCSISMRSHIGVAIVCMVNATAVHEMAEQKVPKLATLIPVTETPIPAQCSRQSLNQSGIVESGYKGTFLWSTEMQSLIISAGFYGNFLIIWFTGYFCDVYGPKIVALIGVFGMSVATILSPTIAAWNYYVFFGLRMMFGIFESPALPSMSAMAARWFPPSERSTIAAIITSGNQLAASLGVVIATNLCSLHFLDGWPLIFYLAALIGFTWCILWGYLATDNPSDSKFLSQEEKDYLFEENGRNHQSSADRKLSGHKMPLKSMIFSKATFAVVAAQFAFNFTNTMMQSYLPSYSRDVLVLDLKEEFDKNGKCGEFKKLIAKIEEPKHFVYALVYLKDDGQTFDYIFYIGETNSLVDRLIAHKKDKNSEKWKYFQNKDMHHRIQMIELYCGTMGICKTIEKLLIQYKSELGLELTNDSQEKDNWDFGSDINIVNALQELISYGIEKNKGKNADKVKPSVKADKGAKRRKKKHVIKRLLEDMNGIFTALPFFIQLISKISMGIFADFLKRKQILSPTTSCKIFQSLASFGCGIIYATMALYVDCTKTTEALVLLGFFGFFLGGAIPGSFTASLSIAPMYAGMIASFTLIAGAFGNILAPAVVGFFVEKGTRFEWGIVFGIAVAVNFCGGIAFLIFGTAKIQSWAIPTTPSKSELSDPDFVPEIIEDGAHNVKIVETTLHKF